MSEEEIIKKINSVVNNKDSKFWIGYNGVKALKNLLELYFEQKKELEKKDKVIDNLYADIEYEYRGTNYLKSLEEYYKESDTDE